MVSQLVTPYRRRMRLLAGTPRELIVPLATPLLFALVIAPALKRSLGSFDPAVDYMTFVAIATVALLVPLNSTFSGISVLVDREHGGCASCSPRRSRGGSCPSGTSLPRLRSRRCR